MSLDIGRAIKFPLDDKDWYLRVALGGIINLVPILNFAAMGYSAEIGRRVVDGEDTPLPTWNKLGEFFKRGLMMILLSIVYLIIPAVFLIIGVILAFVWRQLHHICLLNVFGVLFLICGALFSICGALLIVVIIFLLPLAFINYVRKGNFNAGIAIAEIIKAISSRMGDYIIAVLVVLGLAIAMCIVLSILNMIVIGFLITPFASFYFSLVWFHIFGQVYKSSTLDTSVIGVES